MICDDIKSYCFTVVWQAHLIVSYEEGTFSYLRYIVYGPVDCRLQPEHIFQQTGQKFKIKTKKTLCPLIYNFDFLYVQLQ